MIQLKIQSLTKKYGTLTVFKDLNISAGGPVWGIAGSNGSGKSTLMQCISGLLKPDAGRITWTIGGKQLSAGQLYGMIGYASPYMELYEGLTVTENLKFFQQVSRILPDDGSPRIDQLLDKFQASSFADKNYGALSTGQRQRVKLAAALLPDPPLLFLDEPGANLDRAGRGLIEQTVTELSRMDKMVVIASNRSDELELCRQTVNLDETAVNRLEKSAG